MPDFQGLQALSFMSFRFDQKIFQQNVSFRYVILHGGDKLSAGVLQRDPSERATYLLMRSVKSNKALLLARVTEPGEYTGNPLRRGIAKKMEFKGDNAYGKNNIICKRKGKSPSQ